VRWDNLYHHLPSHLIWSHLCPSWSPETLNPLAKNLKKKKMRYGRWDENLSHLLSLIHHLITPHIISWEILQEFSNNNHFPSSLDIRLGSNLWYGRWDEHGRWLMRYGKWDGWWDGRWDGGWWHNIVIYLSSLSLFVWDMWRNPQQQDL